MYSNVYVWIIFDIEFHYYSTLWVDGNNLDLFKRYQINSFHIYLLWEKIVINKEVLDNLVAYVKSTAWGFYRVILYCEKHVKVYYIQFESAVMPSLWYYTKRLFIEHFHHQAGGKNDVGSCLDDDSS